LDEADLFLIKRSIGELDRNALVTVFLRTLEYFQGIMFLTSNRVEQFDPAFSSRIHLRIPFTDPSSSTRSKIWQTFLPKEWDQSVCDRLAILELNGREIKNLIRTSSLITRHEKKLLSEEGIKYMYATYHARETATMPDQLETHLGT
jgi:AAA+ superfamily predicted ATPase